MRPHGRPCSRGRWAASAQIWASARTHPSVCVDVILTASAGKCGRRRTSGRTFSSKNVRYDIPGMFMTPPPPPSIEIDYNVEYKVEEILDSRFQHRRLEYFIHWKDYGISERTWESSSNCQNASDKIWEFHHRYPYKPGMIGP
jgi:hypothetical protein